MTVLINLTPHPVQLLPIGAGRPRTFPPRPREEGGPARVAADVLMRVKGLHDRHVTDSGRLVCETCQQSWPCATAEQVQRMVVWP